MRQKALQARQRSIGGGSFLQRKRIPCGGLVLGLLLTNLLVVWVTVRSNGDSLSSDHVVNDSDYGLARHQSFGFFDDIPSAEWIQFYATPILKEQPYRFPEDPNHNVGKSVPYWVFYNWDPVLACPRRRLVAGTTYLCDPDRLLANKDCLVYVVGSLHDPTLVAWVDSVVAYFGQACQIHWFAASATSSVGGSDTANATPTTKDWPSVVTRHPEGLTSASTPQSNDPRRIDLLYMDCEGCEWSLFSAILRLHPLQLVVQTHDLPLPDRPKSTTEFGVLPALAMSDVVSAFCQHGYALYAKRVHSATEECRTTDWSFLRLRLEDRQCP